MIGFDTVFGGVWGFLRVRKGLMGMTWVLRGSMGMICVYIGVGWFWASFALGWGNGVFEIYTSFSEFGKDFTVNTGFWGLFGVRARCWG